MRRRAPADVVDDVIAETFLVAWRRLDDIPARELPWLLGVARRVLAAQRRGDDRRARLSVRLAAEPTSLPSDQNGVGHDRLAAALERLSEKDREALLLIAWDGLTPREAAGVLDEPAGRFRVRLHRAKRRCAALLAEPPPADAPPCPGSTVDQGVPR